MPLRYFQCPDGVRRETKDLSLLRNSLLQNSERCIMAKECRSERRGTMPAYMLQEWPEHKLRFKANPTGIRKFIPIPYFSGTELIVAVVIHNDSDNIQELNYRGSLFRLSGITHQTADSITRTDTYNAIINPRSKIKQILQLTPSSHLPQPGNYSLKLNIEIVTEDYHNSYGDIMYFDALPRDASITNWTINILMLVFGTLLGGLAGWIAGSMGD